MLKKEKTYATLPRTERGSAIVLGSDPKGKNFLYTNGNSVVIRELRHPEIADVYTEHSAQTTVAKYSPSGFYVCSADVSGKIRVWDTVNEEHILKAEYQPFVGQVKDVAWSFDSQRLAVVGEGREKFAAVLNMETGTTLGELNGHSKRVNTVDFSKKRPFRIVTGADDNMVCVYDGPPFKFRAQHEHHKRYVQVVRFSPDSRFFASGGFDGQVCVYHSDSGQLLAKLDDAHKGGINGLEWSADSASIVTCAGGDKTVRVFDVGEALTPKTEIVVGADLADQQVGCVWPAEDLILSVSLSGFINYIDPRTGKIVRVLRGHNRPITATAVVREATKAAHVFTGACDGTVTCYDLGNDETTAVTGGHSNQVAELVDDEKSDRIYSLGLDDLLKYISKQRREYEPGFQLKLDSQPRAADLSYVAGEATLFVACYQHVIVVTHYAIVSRLPVAFEPTCVAATTDSANGETLVAVGGGKDKRVHLYRLVGGAELEEVTTKEPLAHREALTCVKFSPNGAYLAATDANRKVVVYARENEWGLAHEVDWGNHSARVLCVDWFSDSQRLVSGSLDTSLVVWDMRTPMKPAQTRKAHPLSAINRVKVLDDGTVLSVGHDSNLRLWSVHA